MFLQEHKLRGEKLPIWGKWFRGMLATLDNRIITQSWESLDRTRFKMQRHSYHIGQQMGKFGGALWYIFS
jgi:hypothetical protein